MVVTTRRSGPTSNTSPIDLCERQVILPECGVRGRRRGQVNLTFSFLPPKFGERCARQTLRVPFRLA
jgi:hypothetical protein